MFPRFLHLLADFELGHQEKITIFDINLHPIIKSEILIHQFRHSSQGLNSDTVTVRKTQFIQ